LASRVPFTSIDFTGPAPSPGDDAAREAFGVAPQYGAPANVARLPVALLEERPPRASEMSVATCEQQCSALLERRRALDRRGPAGALRIPMVRGV
jgi:hypothetical protein